MRFLLLLLSFGQGAAWGSLLGLPWGLLPAFLVGVFLAALWAVAEA